MSFHKRHVTNNIIISIFNKGGVTAVINWYTQNVDSLTAESGLASDIIEIINKDEYKISEVTNRNITKLIHDYLIVRETGNRT